MLTGCSGDNKESQENALSESEQQTEQGAGNSEDNSSSAGETSEEIKPEEGATLKLWMDNDDYNERNSRSME